MNINQQFIIIIIIIIININIINVDVEILMTHYKWNMCSCLSVREAKRVQ